MNSDFIKRLPPTSRDRLIRFLESHINNYHNLPMVIHPSEIFLKDIIIDGVVKTKKYTKVIDTIVPISPLLYERDAAGCYNLVSRVTLYNLLDKVRSLHKNELRQKSEEMNRGEYAKLPLRVDPTKGDPKPLTAYDYDVVSNTYLKKDYSKYVAEDLKDFAGSYMASSYKYTPSGVWENLPNQVKLEIINNEQDINKMDKQLFQIKGTDEYGFVIGRNSQGQMVMELKGSGAIKAVASADLEEVLPYTVDVRFMSGNDQYNKPKSYSFFANAGDFEVGDMVMSCEYSSPMIVTKIDTKSKSATKEITGAVFRATKIIEKKKD